jgi:hypothetical protein
MSKTLTLKIPLEHFNKSVEELFSEIYINQRHLINLVYYPQTQVITVIVDGTQWDEEMPHELNKLVEKDLLINWHRG